MVQPANSSIFQHHKKGHDLVQSQLNMMNGVNTSNPLLVLCRGSKASLIGALSAISSLAGRVLLTCDVSDCFTRLTVRSFLAIIWFSCIVHNVCSRQKIQVARCSWLRMCYTQSSIFVIQCFTWIVWKFCATTWSWSLCL